MFFLKKALSGQALLRKGAGGMKVSFDSIPVFPIFHQLSYIDLSTQILSLNLTESKAVLCRDYIKADMYMLFQLKVLANIDGIKRLAMSFDVNQLSEKSYLEQYFLPIFEEAVRIISPQFYFKDLYEKREEFNDYVREIIGRDLSGFSLENIALDRIEQTSFDFYDSDDFLQEEGKGKIKYTTLEEHMLQENIKSDEKKIMLQTELEALETKQKYEVQIAEAEIQQKLEIARLKAEHEIAVTKINAEKEALINQEQAQKDESIDDKIAKIRTQAQQEREKIEQLRQQQEEAQKRKEDQSTEE